MKRLLLIFALCLPASAQLWSNILSPTYGAGACTVAPGGTYAACGIDWTQSGVPSGIPSGSWTQCTAGACGTANSAGTSATIAQINSALTACGSAGNEYVLLASGTYAFGTAGTISVPSNCELRGAGAAATILQFPSSGMSGAYILLGSTGDVNAAGAVNITAGASAGSTSLTLSSASGVTSGQLMAISELNNPTLVDISGDEGGSCTFCYIVYNWGDGAGSSRVRGQIVHLDTVNTGTGVVTFDPPLFTDYGDVLPNWAATTYYGLYSFITHGGHYYEETANIATTPYHCETGGSTPSFSTSGGSVTDGNCVWLDKGVGTGSVAQAIPFTPAAVDAGVTNLQIYTQDSSDEVPNLYMGQCMYCWESGVEVNYTDADWNYIYQSFRGTIQNSYFSNSFLHTSGSYDATNALLSGTSNMLFINNICERGHIGCMDIERGAAGNVVAYNYSTGAFDGGDYWTIESWDYHGATPQFNLSEGNIWPSFYSDSVWGNAIHHTSFREWLTGTNSICSPSGNPTARTTVSCTPAGYPGQAGKNQWYSFQAASSVIINFSSCCFNIIGDALGSTQAQALVNTTNSAISQADSLVWYSGVNRGYGASWYGETLGFSTTADSGSFGLDNASPSVNSLFHGIYQNVDASTTWQSPITHTLPNSFFLTATTESSCGTGISFWKNPTSGTCPPFPPIGPDVTTGSYVGTHASLNPAAYCYFNTMSGVDGGGGSPLSFSAAACYANDPAASPSVSVTIAGATLKGAVIQ